LLLPGILLLAGCVNPAEDRFEPVNRPVFAFNQGLDKVLIRPLARGYVTLTPELVQDGVYNFFDNLGYPVVVVNQFLQGKPGEGFRDTGRLLVNSTLGIGGLVDMASGMGLRRNEEDFGQTFGYWGIEPGAYVVLPIWGGVTVRDGIGDALDGLLYPPRLLEDVPTRNGIMALRLISGRAGALGTEDLITGDPYVFLRDAYLQRRESLIRDGAVGDPFADDDVFLDDDF
jgi:phospholipid-binding lipoprotein MlaA